MPYLSLPVNEEVLRFEQQDVVLHYLISTPSKPVFRWAKQHSNQLTRSLSTTTTTTGWELDARFPIVVFLPSECFTVSHLFSAQLADETLSSRFNLVAVDPRGHGSTRECPIPPTSERRYDLDIKAADMLDFLRLLLPTTRESGEIVWEHGIHLVACSMSGLVAARMGAAMPSSFASIVITSPILETESRFMIESFQGIKELLEESYHSIHDPSSPVVERGVFGSNEVKLPGEVVQGFTFRWAGEEDIPQHIGDYLARNWLERLVLDERGLDAARDWWFDLYWLRRPLQPELLAKVECDILVVEGDRDLPYDRQVGEEVGQLFPNAKRVKHVVVKDSPFLLSVKRPEQLTKALLEFLGVDEEATPKQENKQLVLEEDSTREAVLGLEMEERKELVSIYSPHTLSKAEEEEESDDEEEEESEEEEQLTPDSSAGRPIRDALHCVANIKLGGVATADEPRSGSAKKSGWMQRLRGTRT